MSNVGDERCIELLRTLDLRKLDRLLPIVAHGCSKQALQTADELVATYSDEDILRLLEPRSISALPAKPGFATALIARAARIAIDLLQKGHDDDALHGVVSLLLEEADQHDDVPLLALSHSHEQSDDADDTEDISTLTEGLGKTFEDLARHFSSFLESNSKKRATLTELQLTLASLRAEAVAHLGTSKAALLFPRDHAPPHIPPRNPNDNESSNTSELGAVDTMDADSELLDVFVSHSSGDKPIVEPIVAALEGAGIRCWYDLLELAPGDNLVNAINHGLTHCKIVLFCLSENFLRGKWTTEELNAAIALSRMQEQQILRLVPLMLTDPAVIQRAYPIPFGNVIYMRWEPARTDDTVTEITKLLSRIDGVSKEYWYSEARKAYADAEYVRSALYARKSVEADQAFYPASVHYVASVLRMGRPEDAYKFIMDKEDDWWHTTGESDVDVELLDYVQDTITANVTGDEIDEVGFTSAIIHFLGTESNAERAWRHLVRLYDKPKFSFHQDDVVLYAAIQGREQAIEWLLEKPLSSREEKVKQVLANVAYVMAEKLADARDKIVEIARVLVSDEFEDVRASALPCYYRFAKDGPARTLEALDDRAPMVRMIAFMLLAGLHRIKVGDDWKPEEDEPGDPDPLFGPEIVKRMLNDPNDMVFEEVVEAIGDGKIPQPPDVDILNMERPPSEDAREAMVKVLAKKDTDESHERLLELALSDPAKFVRSEALDALEEGARPVAAASLRRLYEAETVSGVKGDVESLILEKGDATLGDIYLKILQRNVDSIYSGEKAFEQLAKSNDLELIREGIRVCSRFEKMRIAASQLSAILEKGLLEEAGEVIKWCLDNEEEEALALLAAGKLEGVPLERIERYCKSSSPILRADAFRAMANRRRDGEYVKALRELYEELKPAVLEKDNDACWASLEAIDGIIEFEEAAEAIELLKEYYETLEQVIEGGSFPTRAAWERLRVLGVLLPHDVYDPNDCERPYPWPSDEGPFYGIKRGEA
jgi:hypothetical protein